jgi:membrane protein involved in colicin uptake
MRVPTFDDIAQLTQRVTSKAGGGKASKNLPVIVQEVSHLRARVATLERVCEKQLLALRKTDAAEAEAERRTAQQRAAEEAAARKEQLAEAAKAQADAAAQEAKAAAVEAKTAKAQASKKGGAK